MRSRSQAGIALITSLAILTIVGALILGAILTTGIELNVTRNDMTAAQAQYAAQAGLQKYKAALFQAFRWEESGGGSSVAACENSLSSGINLTRVTGGTIAWSGNRIVLPRETVTDTDGNAIGSYVVTFLQDPTNDSRISIQSIGTTVDGSAVRRATARATATFIVRDSSAIEQAVFAGTGHGMKFFNGNTIVYGGIHVVGDETSPDSVVIDAKGDAAVRNNYTIDETSGTSGFLAAGAQASDNLCASVRVQYGRVNVGGSASFGSASHPLLTVAVGDNPNDINISESTNCAKDGKGVCAESFGIFDLSEDPPTFPMLDEAPATEFCTDPLTWRTCIRNEANLDGMTLVASGSSVSLAGPLATAGATLPAACSSALNAAAAVSTRRIQFGNSNLDCTVEVAGTRYGFRYSHPSGLFEVFGNVNLRGLSMQFANDVKYRAVSRGDGGAVETFAGLSLESVSGAGGQFIAQGSFVPDGVAGKFPDVVMTVIAESDVKLVKNKGMYALPVYSGRDFMASSGSKLFGQVIADRFCTVQASGSADLACSDKGGSPAEIFFVPTGANRPKSFRAIAPSNGLPTFRVEAYELR
ncbi:MAG TPA: hypothetical protein VFN07_09385 [Trueperaceae bacterium]|nr:hypothetical protein [Trueperaceae bacterium]